VPFVDFVVPALKAKSRKAVPRAPSDGACHRTPKRAFALIFSFVFFVYFVGKKEVPVSVSTLGRECEHPIEFFCAFYGFCGSRLKSAVKKSGAARNTACHRTPKRAFTLIFFSFVFFVYFVGKKEVSVVSARWESEAILKLLTSSFYFICVRQSIEIT
jgi:hypothetical protein